MISRLHTWTLVGLRVVMGHGAPGVSSTCPCLGALWIGCPVVTGAPGGVRVPRRPGIITVTSLGEMSERISDVRSR